MKDLIPNLTLEEFFDILTHKTVSKDEINEVKSKYVLYAYLVITAESMSDEDVEIFLHFSLWRKRVRASGGCLGSRRR